MDIKRYDFDYRIADVMPMLEEHYLYGTMSLIRDLKGVVDEIEEIRNKAIDECIKIIEETVWRDAEMLVENIREFIK